MDEVDGGVFLKIGDGETNINDLPDLLQNIEKITGVKNGIFTIL